MASTEHRFDMRHGQYVRVGYIDGDKTTVVMRWRRVCVDCGAPDRRRG